MSGINLCAIGSTKKRRKGFFALLRAASVRCVVEVRPRNIPQLADFAKKSS